MVIIYLVRDNEAHTATSEPGDRGVGTTWERQLGSNQQLIPLVWLFFCIASCLGRHVPAGPSIKSSSSDAALVQHLLLGGSQTTTDNSHERRFGALAWTNSSGSSRRQLQQNLLCPVGCMDSACVQDSTQTRLRCLKCVNSLVVDRITGLCACPPGRSATPGALTCTDCIKGSWCAGGVLTADNVPMAVPCPSGMTTIGRRSTSSRSCVNLPGFSYMVDAQGLPGVFECPMNTYNPGMRRQRTCWPCPAGYTTNGLTGQTDVVSCVVPPGSYMRFPTIVAACPRGQWKSWVGADDYCNSCPDGATTPNQGSVSPSNCTLLLPGYYAATMVGPVVTVARACPQGYYCPGGQPSGVFDPSNPGAPSDATIRPCASQMWTQAPGATSAAQCMTPPGFFTASGVTSKCAAGSYRAGWATGSDGSSCMSCGTGVFTVEDTQLDQYSMTDANVITKVGVATTSASCYIKPGQGVYFVASLNSWRARNCVSDNYGVNVTTYGLNPANCRACPLNMVTSTDQNQYPHSSSYYVDNGDGRTAGFTSKWACVTRPGYGFNGRWSLPCPSGSFNAQDNWSNCTSCAYGLTTAGPGAGVTSQDCGIAPGFGYHSGALQPCPVGYYNDAAINLVLTTPCTQCPTGTTTPAPGAATAGNCSLCQPGYGNSACSTQCGGVGADATFGEGLRPINTSCSSCSSTNLSVNLGSIQTLTVSAASRPGASSQSDCLSYWASYGDSWYLSEGDARAFDVYPAVPALTDCLALCAGVADCELATYITGTGECRVRRGRTPEFRGAPIIAFKTVAAGNASQASGAYVFYQESFGTTLGLQLPAPNATSFTSMQQCWDACTQDTACVAATIQLLIVEAARPATCQLVYGVNDPAQAARSFVRADVTRLQLPVLV